MAKILVSGNAGFIGSATADLLIERGHEVYGLDNLSTGKEENIHPKVNFIKGDIRNLPSLPDVEYIIHTASLARIQPSIDNPIESNDVNVNGTLQLLQYAKKCKAKFIFSSSSSIYDDQLPTKETANISPKNPYALQKWACERYITMYNALHDLDYVIFRYFNVFGERQILEGAYAAVVGIFLDQKSKGLPLTITGDGEQRRDFTYVKDVARANVMGLQLNNGIYNVGTGTNNCIKEIARLVGGVPKHVPARSGEVKATLADSSKLQSFGWKPSVTIAEWIRETSA